MTAGAMQEDRDRAIAAGMDDYLAKPVRKADVLAKLAEWGGRVPSPTSPSGHVPAITGHFRARRDSAAMPTP